MFSFFNTQWLLDSGASDHICNNLSWFNTYEIMTGTHNTITIPDGSHISIQHIGSVILRAQTSLYKMSYMYQIFSSISSLYTNCVKTYIARYHLLMTSVLFRIFLRQGAPCFLVSYKQASIM